MQSHGIISRISTRLFRKEGRGFFKISRSIAAFAFFGMVHYTCKWFRQGGEISAEELGEMFIEIFTKGVFTDPEKN
jgi:hypothetical protein